MSTPRARFAWATVLRRAASIGVVLTGWAALFGTTARHYHWEIVSQPLTSSFDVQPGGEAIDRYLMRIEGHPQLLDAVIFLHLEEPGRDLVDVDAGPIDLPSVEAPTPIEPLPDEGSRLLLDGHRGGVSFRPAPTCAALPCEIEIVVRATASASRYVRTFVFIAGASGSDTNEPPPGRVTLERRSAP